VGRIQRKSAPRRIGRNLAFGWAISPARGQRAMSPPASFSSMAAGSITDTTVGRQSSLHAGPSLLSKACQPAGRVNSFPSERTGSEQWACRLFLPGRRHEILGDGLEPYQELFQGVAVCIHSDFRLGGLRPKETKKNSRQDLSSSERTRPPLLRRYERDSRSMRKQKARR